MLFRRFSVRSVATILLFVIGLFLLIRLVLMQSAVPHPSATQHTTIPSTVDLLQSATPTERRMPDLSPTRRPLLPFPTDARSRTMPPDDEDAGGSAESPSPQPTVTTIAATTTPTSEPPTLAATSVALPTDLPAPTMPATPTHTATVPALPPTTTSIPTGTPRPTWDVPPRLIRNEIDPPWWPCLAGQIKALPKLRHYYPPDHVRYARTFVDVICFDTEQAAEADGYSRAP